MNIQSVEYVSIHKLLESSSKNEADELLDILSEYFTWGDASFTLVNPKDVIDALNSATRTDFNFEDFKKELAKLDPGVFLDLEY